MSTEPEVIDCQLVALPSPLRIGTPKFVASLREVEVAVASLKIVDATTMQAAADLQTRLTKAGNWLEEVRAKLKAPVLEQAKLIDATAKGPMDRIEQAKRTLKTGLLAYNTAQIAIANAAEAQKRAELTRLEGIRQAEAAKAEEEAKAAAEAAAKQPAPAVPSLKLEDDTPTETEKEIARVAAAPAVVVTKPAGLAFRVILTPTVTDIKRLPEQFVIKTANLQAIRAIYCKGFKEGMDLPECPGVEFTLTQEAVTR